MEVALALHSGINCHPHVPSWCGFCAWELWYPDYAIPVCMCWLARWTHVPRRSTVLMWVGKWPGCIVLPNGKGQGIQSWSWNKQYGDPADWMKRGVDCMHHETPTQITVNKKYRYCHHPSLPMNIFSAANSKLIKKWSNSAKLLQQLGPFYNYKIIQHFKLHKQNQAVSAFGFLQMALS